MITERPEWQHHAACHGLTELFFPGRGESTARQKAICATCPVREQCADAGAREHHGIWGGHAERQRRTTRRERAGQRRAAS